MVPEARVIAFCPHDHKRLLNGGGQVYQPPTAKRPGGEKDKSVDMAAARRHMVDSQVRPNRVTDVPLQKAMGEIPRERFVPAEHKAIAYAEQDVRLFDGRWLLKARDFSKLLNDTIIRPDDLVLDVGCGFGYSTAVIARLCSVVVGLEEDEKVVAMASERLAGLDIDNTVMMQGPLAEGCARQAPFDAIIVAGGVEANLEGLLEQLKPDGGRLATIIMNGRFGSATLFTRSGHAFGERKLFEAHPAGVIPAFRRAQGFVF